MSCVYHLSFSTDYICRPPLYISPDVLTEQQTPGTMNTLGLLPLVQHWVSEHAVVKLAIAIPGIVLLLLLYTVTRPDEGRQVAAPLPLTSIGTIWPFFRKRFDFLRDGFLVTGQSAFQFSLLQVCRFCFRAPFGSINLSAHIRSNRIPSSQYRGIWAGKTSSPAKASTSTRASRSFLERYATSRLIPGFNDSD